ncbi:hypothetical protein Bcav_2289 [Beutenbergia cavernae DSM 12333]|uniref:Uncharacterized protein n=1 Tax=Beutenbergia cavernae (strain ATCC BAA-8 / DSM 12333 / CCUG 43141 / JCM 11478 / NBRC 16432 / NCIMB 13614 / HKI 0122) TaxID=471853 RepID=C5BVF3_BEUC1|nr:hypothetical protein [Beutenbergia cavernae]ACQ80540.1 hypothetical protein Bcav_2289 [Beutenbergia cavernae DSM 12333]
MSTTIDRPARGDAEGRIARARNALMAAETAAGVRGGAWSVRTAMAVRENGTSAPAPRLAVAPVPATSAPASTGVVGQAALEPEAPRSPTPSPARSAPPAVAPTDDRFLDVPDALTGLFPFGAMRRGTTTVLTGSSSLELHLAAALMADGAWCAFVARGDLGLAAAAEAGIALDRVAVVPRPGPDAPGVLGALVDGFDVVCVGPCRALSSADRRSLSARVRHRGGVLLSSAPWPGAELTLEVSESSWSGIGSGHGVLHTERLVVEATGRGVGARRVVEVEMRAAGATTSLRPHHLTPRRLEDVRDGVVGDAALLERAG